MLYGFFFTFMTGLFRVKTYRSKITYMGQKDEDGYFAE